MPKSRREEALAYHSEGRPGKIEVVPTKPYSSQHDLSLAYSPGVAEPCLEIEKTPEDAYKYTAKGNLVAVISNGTAVLGLGDIGALAGKPVMEGKGLLFKTFADIDVFDIEVDTKDVDQFIETVRNISPTFGGINLEDIKAPECFEIERRLKEELNIPVMHDDQHGTAIISAAAMLNAVEIVGKKIDKVKVVVNGAGAAAISCTNLYIKLGIDRKNVVMCDSKGVLNRKRKDMNATKKEFATNRDINTLEEAVAGADIFLGLSVADVLTKEMVRTMADKPIVFALANPNPEIAYEEAIASREDIIYATGRSDYPNQVNNVLGFPYIFRGALDVRATKINEEMKIAAVRALADLAKEPVPDTVAAAYSGKGITFGPEYLIPKPLDPRLISRISVAVAKAAIESGVARTTIEDWDTYSYELERRMGRSNKLLRAVRMKVYSYPNKRIVFAEGEELNFIKAASALAMDNLAHPILIGSRKRITKICKDSNIDIKNFEIVDFSHDDCTETRERYGNLLHDKMGRRGLTHNEAMRLMDNRDWFTSMMVMAGDADTAMLAYGRRYTDELESIKSLYQSSKHTLASMVIVTTKKGPMFFSDMAINTNPTTEELVNISLLTAQAVKKLGVEPVMAMLSYSNFGTDTQYDATKVADAVKFLHENHPEVIVDGEMKADVALDVETRLEYYPFSKLGAKEVNTFIFPGLSSANISYKIMEKLGGAEITGPILLGLEKEIHLIPDNSKMRSIVNLALIALSNIADTK